MNALSTLAVVSGLAFVAFAGTPSSQSSNPKAEKASRQKTKKTKGMQLGNFSVSLAVKDIKASKAFYEKLDFKKVGGKLEQNWIILQNGTTTIGLFQGMFKKNVMTFNPGWDKDKNTLKNFQDVRELQAMIKKRGIKPVQEAKPNGKGPASFILADPDGNQIFIDQHVPMPK